LKTKILFSIISATLLLSGCGSSEQDETNTFTQSEQSFELKGVTTLSKATVCVDTNSNKSCDDNEQSTITNNEGEFSFQLASPLHEGETILSTGGHNLILDEKNDAGMKLMSSYHNTKETLNITTLTTLVALAVENGQDYNDAIEYVANRFNIESSLVDANPLQTVQNENTQIHFLTIAAMEKYFLHIDETEDSSKSAPRKAGGWNTGFISYDKADSALDYFDIFSKNVQTAFMMVVLLGNSLLTDALKYLGFINSEIDDGYTFPTEVDVANLHPTLKHVYDNNLSEISRDEIKEFQLLLQDKSINEKYYTDILTIFNSSQIDSNKIFLSSIISSIADESATQNIILMLRASQDASARVTSQLKKDIAKLVRVESSTPLLNYFLRDPSGEYAVSTARAVFKIGVFHSTYFLLEKLQSKYNGELALGEIAYGVEYTISDIRSDKATQNVIDFYYDEKSNEEYKNILRTSLSEIANALAINALYDIAATIDDESMFYIIVSEFEHLKQVAPAAEGIIKDKLYENSVLFKSQELQDRIEDVFKTSK